MDERGEGAAVRREWFGLVAERSADFTHGLFVSHDGGRSLHPHACSGAINPKTHLKYFAALGRVAAVALYHGETLPLRLTDAFLDRAVLGARASLEDLKSVDPTLYANKVRYLMDLHGSADTAAPTRETGFRETADVSLDATLRALDLEWSDAADPTGVFFPGETRAFTLLPTSLTGSSAPASCPVTAETLATYLRAFVAHRTYGGVAAQTAAFAAGFGAVGEPRCAPACAPCCAARSCPRWSPASRARWTRRTGAGTRATPTRLWRFRFPHDVSGTRSSAS